MPPKGASLLRTFWPIVDSPSKRSPDNMLISSITSTLAPFQRRWVSLLPLILLIIFASWEYSNGQYLTYL